jgi:geranylgeranyl diphosphate synthase type II
MLPTDNDRPQPNRSTMTDLPDSLPMQADPLLPAVAARLELFFDELDAQASRFGDAQEIVGQLRAATAGGKRTRPNLVLQVHTALGGGNSRAAIEVAAAYELLHTALIVHDDAIDRDWTRRGIPNIAGHYRDKAAARRRPRDQAEHHGTSAAIIGGDLALSGAVRLVAASETDPRTRSGLLDLMDSAIIAGAVGELADIELPLGPRSGTSDIRDMHRAKTAVYTFESPLQSGALLAGADDETVERLGVFGRELGIAYQYADDISGTFGSEASTGKSPLSDLRGGKHTAIAAFAQTTPHWRSIQSLFGKDDVDEVDLERYREAIRGSGALDHAVSHAHGHLEAAKEALRGLDPALDGIASQWVIAASYGVKVARGTSAPRQSSRLWDAAALPARAE